MYSQPNRGGCYNYLASRYYVIGLLRLNGSASNVASSRGKWRRIVFFEAMGPWSHFVFCLPAFSQIPGAEIYTRAAT